MDLDALKAASQKLALNVSDDKMVATVTVPPGHAPTELEIADLLRQSGVCEGVDEGAIARLVASPAAGDHVVARGIPPEPSEDADIELKFDPDPVPQPRIDDDGRAHYFELGGIPTCSPGDILARRKPSRQGAPGRTVMGDYLDARVPREAHLVAGANTRFVEDEHGEAIVADKAGQPVRRGTLVMVRDVYIVPGDLDVAVGNIDYNGPVVIHGKVNEQLVLRAKGDITIDGNVESATVVCGGDLTVKGGILRESKVVVAGSLRTRFIERSQVQVEQHAFVQEDVLFSDVEVGGSLEVQSGIVGGKCQAAGYVRATYLGKRLGTQTVLEVGIVTKWNERLQTAEAEWQEAQEELAKAMEPLKELLVLEAAGGLDERAQALKEKLERSAQQTRERVAERLKTTLRLKGAIQSLPIPKVLTPGGVIHPGVQVQIRNAYWKAETTTRASTLSEHRGEIQLY